MRYGYVRVSTDMQDYNSQRQGILNRYSIDEWREDTGTGRITQPNLLRLIHDVRAGDEVVVYAFDRLGRKTQDVIGIVASFRKKQVGIISVREGIDLNSPAGNMVFQMMCSIAEFESSIIADRVKAGMQAAKLAGAKFGRPTLLDDPKTAAAIEQAKQLRKAGLSYRRIEETLHAAGFDFSVNTIRKYAGDNLDARYRRELC